MSDLISRKDAMNHFKVELITRGKDRYTYQEIIEILSKLRNGDMDEIWRDIKGYEGFYQVSDRGNVRSLRRHKCLKPIQKPDGYQLVHFYVKGKDQWLYIHRLVAETFIPKEQGHDVINHKDNNRSNNVVWNLEWVTRKENIQYAVKQGRMYQQKNWTHQKDVTKCHK